VAEFSFAGRTTSSPTRRTTPALATPPRSTSSCGTVTACHHLTRRPKRCSPWAARGNHTRCETSLYAFDSTLAAPMCVLGEAGAPTDPDGRGLLRGIVSAPYDGEYAKSMASASYLC
jgi:hypothetical protein